MYVHVPLSSETLYLYYPRQNIPIIIVSWSKNSNNFTRKFHKDL